MTTPAAPAKTNRQAVLDAVGELAALEQHATRETVATITGLKLSIVDDHLGTLVDDGLLQRILRGHYTLVVHYPPARNISKEVQADGMVMYEFSSDAGSTVLKLTPKEDRMLSGLTAGAGAQLVAIEANREQQLLLTSMAAQLEQIRREHRALLAAREAQDSPQLSLPV